MTTRIAKPMMQLFLDGVGWFNIVLSFHLYLSISGRCMNGLTRWEARRPVRPSSGSHVRSLGRPARAIGLVRRRFHFSGGLFDERGHRIRLRHVDRVTARDLDDSRTRALGHEALSRRWDHLVVGGNQVPDRLGLP